MAGFQVVACPARAAESRLGTAPALSLPDTVEGAGPPLVMLGGGSGGAASFAPHAQRLGLTHRVIRLQSLNNAFADHGLTLPDDYSIKLESRAMGRTLDSLHLRGPIDVVGHSLGALIALDFALDHPRRVRSLALAEPPAFWLVRDSSSRDSNLVAMLSLLRELGPKAEITDEQVARFHCLLGACPDGQSPRDDPRWPEWVRRKDALRGLAAVGRHTDDVRRLRALRCPVLIMTGASTVSFHRRIDEVLARQLPNVRRVELPGGHGSPLTAPDEFLKALEDFLARRP